MVYSELRDFAYKARGDELRNYAAQLLKQDPNLVHEADSLELVAFLVDTDFAGAEAKLETLQFKYSNSPQSQQIISTSNLVRSHLNFAFGRFEALQINVEEELKSFESGISKIEVADILQMLRLSSQKDLILNDFVSLSRIAKMLEKSLNSEDKDQAFYLRNSILAMTRASEGEHRKALELANKNIKIAELNNYTGILFPFDSLYVKAISLMAMALPQESLLVFEKLKSESLKYEQWPWYYLADGYFSRELAINNKLPEALSIIREERELISKMNLQNELSFFPDSSELFIRYLIKDIERIEILTNRLPNTILVQQIRALKEEWNGRDMLEWIKSLPESTARERIYKLVALADYFSDRESVAVDYMQQALKLVEETGAIEFLLRQHKLFDIIIKAAHQLSTPFTEDIARRITDRARENQQNRSGSIPVPLTTRELEVIRHLATGKPISAVSEALHVSMNTMKTHLRNIYRKLDVDGRESAVEKAKSLFLI